jgi:hypothetical protein
MYMYMISNYQPDHGYRSAVVSWNTVYYIGLIIYPSQIMGTGVPGISLVSWNTVYYKIGHFVFPEHGYRSTGDIPGILEYCVL